MDHADDPVTAHRDGVAERMTIYELGLTMKGQKRIPRDTKGKDEEVPSELVTKREGDQTSSELATKGEGEEILLTLKLQR